MGAVLLASRGRRSGMRLSILQCTDGPHRRTVPLRVLVGSRLRNPGMAQMDGSGSESLMKLQSGTWLPHWMPACPRGSPLKLTHVAVCSRSEFLWMLAGVLGSWWLRLLHSSWHSSWSKVNDKKYSHREREREKGNRHKICIAWPQKTYYCFCHILLIKQTTPIHYGRVHTRAWIPSWKLTIISNEY